MHREKSEGGPRRRRWVLVGSLVVTLALVCVGWFAAQKMQSPAQREAKAAAPSAQPVTVPIERGALNDTVSVNATVAPSSATTIKLTAPGDPAYVTKQFAKVGQSLSAGQALVAVNDRPVFVLPGPFPLYRDLAEGDTGDDVREVQQGLREAGFSIPDSETGTFGSYTTHAVRKLYDNLGYDAPTSSQPAAEPANTDQASGAGPTPSASPSASATEAVQVRRSEFLIVSALPQQVSSLPPIGSADLTIGLSTGALSAKASVPAEVAARLSTGLPVTLSDSSGKKASGTITALQGMSAKESTPATDAPGADAPAEPVVVMSAKPGSTFPASWTNSEVLTEIQVQQIASDALLVPTRAIAFDSAGKSSILVKRGSGFQSVSVTEIGSYAGTSAISSTDSSLKSGDLVRVDRAGS